MRWNSSLLALYKLCGQYVAAVKLHTINTICNKNMQFASMSRYRIRTII